MPQNISETRLPLLRSLDNGAKRVAGVAELVDAVDSKSTARKGLPVRVRPPVPLNPVNTDAEIRMRQNAS